MYEDEVNHDAAPATGPASDEEDIPPAMIAGLMLAANHYLRASGLPHLPVARILQTAGSGQARAYQCRRIIYKAMREAARPVGRPRAAGSHAIHRLTREALDFLMRNPGAISGTKRRRTYGRAYRAFVLEQRRKYPDMSICAFADALRVPLPTLRKWLHPDHGDPSRCSGEDARVANTVRALLAAWKTWDGTFTGFCAHARKHLGLSYKRTHIAQLLEQSGARQPTRRAGRSPDERALRASFATFFPGAQWVADGKTVSLTLNGTRHTFNFELVVDTASAALLGASLRDKEDTQAVIVAFSDAVANTRGTPVSLLLDNYACNRSTELARALPQDTLLVHSTKGRPQSKGHVEGAFGLFSQSLPPLHINAEAPRECARQILTLIIQTWARTLNYRPRKSRGSHSRVQLYSAPGQDMTHDRAHARMFIARDAHRRVRARSHVTTQRARAVAVIEQAFAHLALPPPSRHLLSAISRYPLQAILAGVATYEGKKTAGTLPANLREPCGDPVRAGRYLLALIRNIATEDEAAYTARAMWTGMSRARDDITSSLKATRQTLVNKCTSLAELIVCFTDRAIDSSLPIDRLFWIDAIAHAIRCAAHEHRDALFYLVSQYVHTSPLLSPSERSQTVRLLASWTTLLH